MDEGLIHIIGPRAEYEEGVNMVSGCPGEFIIFDVEHMNDDLVQMHAIFYHMAGQVEHQYGSCRICCRDSRGCSIVRKGIQLLLDNGTIKVSGQRDNYYEVNEIEVDDESYNDEYASADELFSSDENLFSGDDSLMTEEGVNVIVPCFNDSTPFEIEYFSKLVVSPVVICLPGPVPYKSNKVVPY